MPGPSRRCRPRSAEHALPDWEIVLPDAKIDKSGKKFHDHLYRDISLNCLKHIH